MDKEFNIQRIVAKTTLLGQVLLKKGLINGAQLEEALAIQKKEGGLLGDILVKKEFTSEELLCTALASQSDMCYVPVERYKITKDVLRLIPKDVAAKYCVIPLEKIGGVLTMAMANPFDQEAISTIETLTHYRIVSVIGTKTQIERLIKLHYQA